MPSLNGKVAFITGGSSGIGKAAAIGMSRAGAKVGILGVTEDRVRQASQDIRQETGGEVLTFIADVSQPQGVEEAINDLVNTWGRLDIVFANAGINGVWASLEDLSPDDWDQTLDINLKGTFLTVKSALPHLKQRGGSVIVTSSVNGTRMFSNTGATAYACAKAGQVAFTKMIAVELAPHGIRANVICPGAIDTNIEDNTEEQNLDEIRYPVEYPQGKVPLSGGQPGSSEQVAQLVVFLASDAASHITGTEIWIDGAQSLFQG